MKAFCFTKLIIVFLFCITIGIQAETMKTKLDQVELMQAWVGTWQRVISKDSILVLGKGCYSFSAKDDKFKMFSLTADGNYATFIVFFTTEKKWAQYLVQDFNPEKNLLKGGRETCNSRYLYFYLV